MNKRSIRLLATCLVTTVASCSVCNASKPPPPQYVNIAPLPGAGLALNSEGRPDGQGAMQINIPVAYTPGADFVSAGVFAGQFLEGDKSDPAWNNGTGTLAMGFGGWPRVYGSAMAVSSILFHDSKVLSGQLQFIKESKNTPAVAVGAQDLLDKESADFGATTRTDTAYYGVATKQIKLAGRNAYATLGYGTTRFLDRPFGGISIPINNHFTLAAEYDGFQINTAVGWRPAGRFSGATVLAGYNGQAGPLVGVQGAGKISGLWAIPAVFMFVRH